MFNYNKCKAFEYNMISTENSGNLFFLNIQLNRRLNQGKKPKAHMSYIGLRTQVLAGITKETCYKVMHVKFDLKAKH